MQKIDTTYRAKHYGGKNVPKYIVIHYTANSGTTATAKSNARYFSNTDREASAHYIIDEGNVIYCCVPPWNAAYAVGDKGKGKLKGIVTNYNSISVEAVSHSNENGYYIPDKTISNVVEFVRRLMSEYNIPINNVVRHYDVTGKMCPLPFVDDVKWNEFIERITGDDMTEIEDLKRRIKILEDKDIVYNWTEACPQWTRPYIQKALDLGWIKGDENGFLGLTDDTIKCIVIMLRKEGIMQ